MSGKGPPRELRDRRARRRGARIGLGPAGSSCVAAFAERVQRECGPVGAHLIDAAPPEDWERALRLSGQAIAHADAPAGRALGWAKVLDFWANLLQRGSDWDADPTAWLLAGWLPGIPGALDVEALRDVALAALLDRAPVPDLVVEDLARNGALEEVVRSVREGVGEGAGASKRRAPRPAASAEAASAAPTARPARLIALCGLDGSGKSSVLARLEAEAPGLAAFTAKRSTRDVDAVEHAFAADRPGRDPYLSGPFAEAIRWAYACDFLRYYDREVRPRLERGETVVSDRWSTCAISYADAGVGLGNEIASLLSCVPAPDLTIYLEVPPEEASRRLTRRGDRKACEDERVLHECAEAERAWLERVPGPVARVANVEFEATCRRVAELARSAIAGAYAR